MNNVTIIIEEIPQRCCRPYGLNHEEICNECATLDPALTEIRMREVYLGEYK